jgi:four helix bundle protein
MRLARDVARAIPISAGRRAPGLRAQALRAAQRIADAIAEGCGKNSDRELARFAEISAGSVAELQSQLVFALIHRIIPRDVYKRLWDECCRLRRMLDSFQRVVRKRADRTAAHRKRKRVSTRKDPKRLIPKKAQGRPPVDPDPR